MPLTVQYVHKDNVFPALILNISTITHASNYALQALTMTMINVFYVLPLALNAYPTLSAWNVKILPNFFTIMNVYHRAHREPTNSSYRALIAT